MTQPGDSLALYLILGIIIYFIVRQWLPLTFTQWLAGSKKTKAKIEGRVPKLLEKNGYEVLEEKIKIPMTIELDDDQQYESRLYIDYIAQKEDERYLVFVERAHRPLKQYGAGLRDAFLPFFLLYRPDGILYVKKDRTIHVIDFEIEDLIQKKSSRHLWLYLAFFLLGLILAWLSR